jgi:hypothetical protein
MEGVAMDGPLSGVNTWDWAEGKHCLTYTTIWSDKNGTARASALCGWDPLAKQLVETEYWTGGSINTLRYSKKDDTTWQGTMSGVDKNGKKTGGKIAYEFKSPKHLIFRATEINDGGESRQMAEIHYYKK